MADLELAATGDASSHNDWHPPYHLLHNSTLSEQFATAFFWGAGMVTAMIPYDIEPSTAVESYFTAVCMFISLLLNAIVIGSMASALSSMDSKKAIAAGKLETIGAYLQMNKVEATLKGQILEFYEYLYTSSQSMENLRLYQDLPPSLASRLAISVHRRMLSRCALLAGLSSDALLGILSRLRPRIYVPAQIIIVDGQPHTALHFVKKGRVSLLRGLNTPAEVQIRSVGQHEHFGLDLPASSPNARHRADEGLVGKMLLTTQYASEAARAETYCDVVSLFLSDLLEIFAEEKAWSKVALASRSATSAPRSGGRCGRRLSIRRMNCGSSPPGGSPLGLLQGARGQGNSPPGGSALGLISADAKLERQKRGQTSAKVQPQALPGEVEVNGQQMILGDDRNLEPFVLEQVVSGQSGHEAEEASADDGVRDQVQPMK